MSKSRIDDRDGGHPTLDTRTAITNVLLLPVIAACLLILWGWSAALVVLLGVPVLVAFAFDRGGYRFRVWALYILGFGVFAILRAKADQSGFPIAGEYALNMDRLIGLGALPSIRLQSLFRTRALDLASSWIYISYFVIPPSILIVGWIADLRMERYVFATLAVFAVSLCFHVVLPTEPPWMFAVQGKVHGLDRIFFAVMHPGEVTYSLSQNDVAAMPSVHIAVTTLVVAVIGSWGRGWRVAGYLYMASMVFAVVYLGEHFAVDALAGAMVGVAAWRLARVTERSNGLYQSSTPRGSFHRSGQWLSWGGSASAGPQTPSPQHGCSASVIHACEGHDRGE